MEDNVEISGIFNVRWSDLLAGEPMKCPKCDEELNYDEVDIGVGTMRGNYHCNACGWSDQDDIISS